MDCEHDKSVGYATGMYCRLITDDDLSAPGAISRVCDVPDEMQDLIVVIS